MRFSGLSPVTRGIVWALAAGLSFSIANAMLRALTQSVNPLQAQFLRYLFGMIPVLPLLWQWLTSVAAWPLAVRLCAAIQRKLAASAPHWRHG